MKERNPIQIREAWLLCFILGIVMLNYPFIHIFNKETMVYGIPALFLYFMIGWPASILVIFLFCRTLGEEQSSGKDDERSGKGGQ